MSETPLVISGRAGGLMLGKGFIVLARRGPDGDGAPVAYVADSLEAANLCLHDNCFAELLAALKAIEDKLFELASEFNGPRFTDRHGDGPVLLALAEQARNAIAKAEQQDDARGK